MQNMCACDWLCIKITIYVLTIFHFNAAKYFH